MYRRTPDRGSGTPPPQAGGQGIGASTKSAETCVALAHACARPLLTTHRCYPVQLHRTSGLDVRVLVSLRRRPA